MKEIILKPLGYTCGQSSHHTIFLEKKYVPALLHLEKFSHIILFWINEGDSLPVIGDNLEYDRSLKFKTKVSQNIVHETIAMVKSFNSKDESIDVITSGIPSSSAIVDIKPYMPIEDRIKNVAVAEPLATSYDFWPEQSFTETKNTHVTNVSDKKPEFSDFNTHSIGTYKKEKGLCYIELEDSTKIDIKQYKGFSHIKILWWFNRFEKEDYRKTTQVNPPYEGAPKTGVFGTRSPVRPNPIAMTTTAIIRVDEKKNRIEIAPIDAFNKTPIVDVKPYIPILDRVENAAVPLWLDHWAQWKPEFTEGKAKKIHLKDGDLFTLHNDYGEIIDNVNGENTELEKAGHSATNDNHIVIKGAEENNLKNISVEIPKNKITVVTGLSGSGKSSLAFNVLYAESQRRFMDSISSAGRQYFKQFEKPSVNQILNLPPAIAVEQKSVSRNTRSTVGTLTDINDYLRLLYGRVGIRHCIGCGRAVVPQTESEIVHILMNLPEGTEFTIGSIDSKKNDFNFIIPESEKISTIKTELNSIVVELLHNNKGALIVKIEKKSYILHTRNHCYYCDISYFDLSPSMFSSNNPESMCPHCEGLGTQMTVSEDLIVSRPELSILDGASDWWGDMRKFIKKPSGNWMKGEIVALGRHRNIDLEKPWKELPKDFRNQVLYGNDGEIITLTYEGSRGRSGDISRSVEGAVNHIQRLFKSSHGKSSEGFYLQFMEKTPCSECNGEQLNRESRMVTVGGMRYPEAAALTIDKLHDWFCDLALFNQEKHVSQEVIQTMMKKTRGLLNVGLHYLSLKRSMATLSGGEAQRLRLSNQLGSGLNNLLYILDEPSVGLHPSDHQLLIKSIKDLRDNGNTLVVVEHETAFIEEADHIIDIGPGAGVLGGEVVAKGSPEKIVRNKKSITGKYLHNNGWQPQSKMRKSESFVTLEGASMNNLKSVDAIFPLGAFISVAGKSGSGKSSLISQTLSPVLTHYCNHGTILKGEYKKIKGLKNVHSVVTITQEAIGRTPRSNPATYTGLFDEVRNLFASTDEAQKRNYTANRFSFNNKEGRCQSCEGDGRKKVSMSFMADVWITCKDCGGKRFNDETLEVTYKGLSIADVLNLDVDQGALIFKDHPKVEQIIKTLDDVGLGYLKLGQSALTLSGGEAQRIKLAKELSKSKKGNTVYILDEPTTGLHCADTENLLLLLQRMVDDGNTVIVIEHNMDVIKASDWVIDLGPEGGEEGGDILFQGPSEELKNCEKSFTGKCLR